MVTPHRHFWIFSLALSLVACGPARRDRGSQGTESGESSGGTANDSQDEAEQGEGEVPAEGVQECPPGHEWADGACHPSQGEAPTEGEGETDTDGDRLPDTDEAVLGTDPNVADSDGDGYLDGHEVQAGSDPTDAESVIYKGGWPYNPDKDELEQGNWDVPPADGNLLPRWTATDQYGDTVDLYDFIGDGKPVVLDVGTRFCKPCKGIAAWLTSGDPSHETDRTEGALNSFRWWNEDYQPIYEMIENGEIHWITVLWSACTEGGTATTPQDAVDWHEEWPNHHVPVLVDPDCQLKDYLDVIAMPHVDVLDDDLRFLLYVGARGGPSPGFRRILEL